MFRSGTTLNWLSPPLSTLNPENAPQTCLQSNVIKSFSQLKCISTSLSQVDNKQANQLTMPYPHSCFTSRKKSVTNFIACPYSVAVLKVLQFGWNGVLAVGIQEIPQSHCKCSS